MLINNFVGISFVITKLTAKCSTMVGLGMGKTWLMLWVTLCENFNKEVVVIDDFQCDCTNDIFKFLQNKFQDTTTKPRFELHNPIRLVWCAPLSSKSRILINNIEFLFFNWDQLKSKLMFVLVRVAYWRISMTIVSNLEFKLLWWLVNVLAVIVWVSWKTNCRTLILN